MPPEMLTMLVPLTLAMPPLRSALAAVSVTELLLPPVRLASVLAVPEMF